MRTIPAREIKRRGIGAVDSALKDGPVHIIRNDVPAYVVMDEKQFQELVEEAESAYEARIKSAVAEVRAGKARRVTAKGLRKEFGLGQ